MNSKTIRLNEDEILLITWAITDLKEYYEKKVIEKNDDKDFQNYYRQQLKMIDKILKKL